MAERYVMRGQPSLQCTDEGARCVLDEMRETVMRDDFAPVLENLLRSSRLGYGWCTAGARVADLRGILAAID